MKKIVLFIILLSGLLEYHFTNSQWAKLNTGVNYKLNNAFFINENSGYVCGRGLYIDTTYLLKTSNGGLNWQVIPVSIYGIKSVWFLNESTGFGIGHNIYKTTDGGINWSINLNVGFNTTTDVQFIDSNNGFVTYTMDNLYSGIYRTSNSGLNWSNIQSIGTAGTINCVYFIDPNTGFVGGWEPIHGPGTIYKTTNAGVNWYHSIWLVGPPVMRISFLNYNTGFCVQSEGPVYITSNAGLNWISYDPFFCCDYKAFSLDTIYTIDNHYDSSYIMRTTDGCNTWEEQFCVYDTTFFFIELHAIFFVNRNVGYVVGDSGYVLKTTNGGDPIGIRKISNDVPKKFSIFQNYPNPFNPTTLINYVLPLNNKVKLVVYDILGREVVTLVNEKQQAGKYQVTWDASNFASGVYFYTLKTDNFSETKKMVLVK